MELLFLIWFGSTSKAMRYDSFSLIGDSSSPSPPSSWGVYSFVTRKVTLWISMPALSGGAVFIAFFVSGFYTTRIVYGRRLVVENNQPTIHWPVCTLYNRYVSRCNVVLCKFNIFFEKESGKLIILRREQQQPSSSSSEMQPQMYKRLSPRKKQS